MKAAVSVIVPVFNTEKYLRECLDSIIAQTIFDRMEILLVDDGSDDASPSICDEYAGRYERIGVIHQANLGVSAARNAGLRMAAGKYAGFVDSDDTIKEDMYEKLVDAAEKTGADLSCCGYIFSLPDAQKNISFPFEEERTLARGDIIRTVIPYMIRSDAFNSCCNKLFSLSVIRQNGIVFPEGRKHAEDRRFVAEFLLCCESMSYIDYHGYFYRYVETGAVNAARTDYLDNMLAKYAENIDLFGEAGLDRAVLNENNALSLASQALSGAYFIESKLSGKVRRDTLRQLARNRQIRRCLADYWGKITAGCSTYEKMVFRMIRSESAAGLHMVIRAMDIRLRLKGQAK
ncbi:MAG TPA: glycosyltransferase [Clostridiales bacterium]|nr:MAG: putative glycosyltransferase EpsJ [Firmicutes bacterium ADurb.Bin262]HOU09747.1 glycosyltransferase [Clostridiales bacterium]HQH62313.1 glycosyltransferase [Clostridiales bacterium]HQK72538.1 glycosyltransferase [Clostridiales bacterium]